MRNLWNILLILLAGCATQTPKPVAIVPGIVPPPAVQPAMRMALASVEIVVPPAPARVLTLTASAPCYIETSADLHHWQSLAHLTNSLTISNLQAQLFYRGVSKATLAWDSSPDVSVAGYRIYAGQSSRDYTRTFDAGLTNTFLCPAWFGTNYFAATAYDAYGVESDFSNEASCVAAQPTLQLK